MLATATTTVSILRGTSTNSAGDVIDTGAPVYTGVIASLIERTRTGIDAAVQDIRVFRYIVCRLPAGTDVLDTDQILDETTSLVYNISAVSRLANPFITSDLRLDLQRVN